MIAKELTMLDKMLFINDNKELFKDNILTRIENENVALLLLNMLLDTKKKSDTIEYQKLLKFVMMKQVKEQRESATTCDILGVIKTYVSKAYNGGQEFNIVLNKLNACERSFIKYQELNDQPKIMTI